MQLPFQKFFFVGEADPSYIYLSDSVEDRKKDDVAMYMKHRTEKKACIGSDDSLYYYLIASKWMSVWRKFANGEVEQPSMIVNKHLADKIFKRRRELWFPIHDNDVKLSESDDFYMVN